jgi:hypothetical protein
VTERTGRSVVISSDIPGPGRFLHGAYSWAGQYVEDWANTLAHVVGFGPEAVAIRIEKAFGDRYLRQSRLDELYDFFKNGGPCKTDFLVRVMEKDSQELLAYACP